MANKMVMIFMSVLVCYNDNQWFTKTEPLYATTRPTASKSAHALVFSAFWDYYYGTVSIVCSSVETKSRECTMLQGFPIATPRKIVRDYSGNNSNVTLLHEFCWDFSAYISCISYFLQGKSYVAMKIVFHKDFLMIGVSLGKDMDRMIKQISYQYKWQDSQIKQCV